MRNLKQRYASFTAPALALIGSLILGSCARPSVNSTTADQSQPETQQTPPSPPPPAQPSVSAELVAAKGKLEQQGFDCGQTVTIDRGLRCRGLFKGYPLPVNLFFPSTFKPQAELDFALHLHGFNVGREASQVHFRIDDGSGDFGKWLNGSGKNIFIVAPESKEQCDDFNSYLSKGPDVENFLLQLIQLIFKAELSRSTKIGKWILTGHSGAYFPIASILILSTSSAPSAARLAGVGLFDASYGRAADFAAGVKAHALMIPKFYFWSAFISGSQTEAQSTAIARSLGVKIESTKLTFPPAPNATNRVIGVSGASHNWFLKDQRYEQFLIDTHSQPN